MTTGEAFILTVAVFALGFGFGGLCVLIFATPREGATVERAAVDWVELGGKYHLRERTQFSQRQVQALLDQGAAKDRRIAELQAQVRELRSEPGSIDRELRLVHGGERPREGCEAERAGHPLIVSVGRLPA